MPDLNEAELDALAEIAKDDRLKLTVAQEHRRKLLALGYAEERDYGLIATGKGRMALRMAGRSLH